MTQTGQSNSYKQPIYTTNLGTETSQINYQIGTPWYSFSGSVPDATWASDMHYDISANFVPVGVTAAANLFANRALGGGTNHTVAAYQDDYVDGRLIYWDTATSYASGGSTNSDHNVARSSLEVGGSIVGLIW